MKSKSRLSSSLKNSVLFLNLSGCNTFILCSFASCLIGVSSITLFLHTGLSGCDTTNCTSIFQFFNIQSRIFFENSHVQKNAIFIIISLFIKYSFYSYFT
ncbi:MAG: hypothetical protein Q8S84_08240 [bacterium]|nr:hypothetical protein [bacterium]MDP3381424.1 hypothetical protein [bacterium]